MDPITSPMAGKSTSKGRECPIRWSRSQLRIFPSLPQNQRSASGSVAAMACVLATETRRSRFSPPKRIMLPMQLNSPDLYNGPTSYGFDGFFKERLRPQPFNRLPEIAFENQVTQKSPSIL